MTETTYRCFAAVDLSEDLTRTAARVLGDLRERVPTGVKWVRDDQLHVTVKFFGAVPVEELDVVQDALATAARACGHARLTLVGAGTFPPRGAPRVVWLGLRDEGGALAALHMAVEQASEGAGFPRESRGFRPHLTLGRVRPGGDRSRQRAKESTHLVEALTPFSERVFGECAVDRIVLYRSELRREGALYTALATFPLGGDAA